MLSPEEYQEYLDFAVKLGREAAAMIREGSDKRFADGAAASTKANAVDLVTETDQAVEKHLMDSIKERYPSHGFIGEEDVSAGGSMELGDGFTWVVDPVDGTMNFVHNNPNVGTSIGLMHDKMPVVGVIAMPFLDQFFSARIGGGCYLERLDGSDKEKVPLRGKAAPLDGGLRECLVMVDFASDRNPVVMNTRMTNFINLLGQGDRQKMVHGLRISGASTSAITQLVLGQVDVNFDAGPYPWDYCAGAVLMKEAGAYLAGGKRSFERGTDTLGEIVMGRRYCSVRPCASTEGETAEEKQKKIVGEIYEIAEEWTTKSMHPDYLP